MQAAIRKLRRRRKLTAKDIDRFIESHTFPIVEGGSVTFVYRGEAEKVLLQHWIYALPTAQPFQRLAATDLWYLTVDLPENSRVEYKIEVRSNGKADWILDPLNPLLAHDPFGANSVCQASGYERPAWTLPDAETRSGRLETATLKSKVFGPRQLEIYVPGRFRGSRKYPLLLVHDGPDYVRYAQLKVVLDNLIHRLEIAPLIVALLQPGKRLREYAGHPDHSRFLVDEVVPFLEREFPLIPEASSRGLMGASLGAVAALHTAWSHPGLFGRLLLQSGSFVFSEIGSHSRGPEFDPVERFMNRFREKPGTPAERIFLSCGVYESLIYENRSLAPMLQRSGMEIRYREARDGHNWENWRDRLRDGLSWLFPGPLWMVYE